VTVSLFAVALDDVLAAWRRAPLAELVADRPSGRVAATLRLPGLAAADLGLPAARAAQDAGDARELFEALLDDRAAARLFDAPVEALAAAARALGVRPLDDDAPPAYPAELPARAGAPVVWPLARAAPVAGASPDAELAAALSDVVEAAGGPGMSLVASR
jgi:hypothetical protein